MKTQTLKDLKIGSVIRYNDIVNLNIDFVVLDSEETMLGTFVNVLNKKTDIIEAKNSNTEITGRWTLISK